jgi:hypothetical protein
MNELPEKALNLPQISDGRNVSASRIKRLYQL